MNTIDLLLQSCSEEAKAGHLKLALSIQREIETTVLLLDNGDDSLDVYLEDMFSSQWNYSNLFQKIGPEMEMTESFILEVMQFFIKLLVKYPQRMVPYLLKLKFYFSSKAARVRDVCTDAMRRVILADPRVFQSKKEVEDLMNCFLRELATKQIMTTIKDTYRYASVVLTLKTSELTHRYDAWRSACLFLSKCASKLSKELMDGLPSLVQHLKPLMAHKNAQLSEKATKAYLEVLHRAGGFVRSQLSTEESLAKPDSQLFLQITRDLMQCLTASTSVLLSDVVVAATGLSHIREVLVMLLSNTEFLNIVQTLLECIDQTEIGLSKPFSPVGPVIDGYDLSQLIRAIANITFVLMEKLLPKFTDPVNLERASKLANETKRLLMRLCLQGVEAYPRLSIKMSSPLAGAIRVALIKSRQSNHVSSLTTRQTEWSDLDVGDFEAQFVYFALIRCCCHQPLILTSLTDAHLMEESGDADSGSGASETMISCRDYLPLWHALIQTDSKESTTSSNVIGQFSDSLLHRILNASVRLLRRLNLSYRRRSMDERLEAEELKDSDRGQDRQESSDEHGSSSETLLPWDELIDMDSFVLVEERVDRVQFERPKDVVIFMNLVDLLENLLSRTSDRTILPWLPRSIETVTRLAQRYPLLSGFYQLLNTLVSVGIRSRLSSLNQSVPSIELDLAWSNVQTCLGHFVSGLCNRLIDYSTNLTTYTNQVSAGLEFLLSLPLSVLVSALPYTSNVAELFYEQQLDQFVQFFTPLLITAVQLGDSQYPRLWTAVVQALNNWILELERDGKNQLIHTLCASFCPVLRAMLLDSSSESMESTSSREKSDPLSVYHDQLIRASHSSRQGLTQSVRLIDRLNRLQQSENNASLDPTRLKAIDIRQRAQCQLLQLIGRFVGALSTFQMTSTIPSTINQPIMSRYSIPLRLCIPYTDLRAYWQLNDPNVWRLTVGMMQNFESNAINITAANYIHSLVLFIIGKAANTMQHNAEPAPHQTAFHDSLNQVLTPSDGKPQCISGHVFRADNETVTVAAVRVDSMNRAALHDLDMWQHLFLTCFHVAANQETPVQLLFQTLVFQLTRWYSTYTISGQEKAVCFFRVLLQLLHLTDATDETSRESSWKSFSAIEENVARVHRCPCDLPLVQILAARCLRRFLLWSASRSSRVSTVGATLPTQSLFTEPIYDTFIRVLEAVQFTLKHAHPHRCLGALCAMNQTILPIMHRDKRLAQRHIFKVLSVLLETAAAVDYAEGSSVLLRAIASGVRQVMRLILQLVSTLPLGTMKKQPKLGLHRPVLKRTTIDADLPTHPPASSADLICPLSWSDASLQSCLWALLDHSVRPCKTPEMNGTNVRQACLESFIRLTGRIGELILDRKLSSPSTGTFESAGQRCVYFLLGECNSFDKRLTVALSDWTVLSSDGFTQERLSAFWAILNTYNVLNRAMVIPLETLHAVMTGEESRFRSIFELFVDLRTNSVICDDASDKSFNQTVHCCELSMAHFAVSLVQRYHKANSLQKNCPFGPNHKIWHLFATRCVDSKGEVQAEKVEDCVAGGNQTLFRSLPFVYQETIMEQLEGLLFTDSVSKLDDPTTSLSQHCATALSTSINTDIACRFSQSYHLLVSMVKDLDADSPIERRLQCSFRSPSLVSIVVQHLQSCSVDGMSDLAQHRKLVSSIIQLAVHLMSEEDVVRPLLDCLFARTESSNITNTRCSMLTDRVLIELLLFGAEQTVDFMTVYPPSSLPIPPIRSLLGKTTLVIILERLAMAWSQANIIVLNYSVSLLHVLINVCIDMESADGVTRVANPDSPLSSTIMDCLAMRWVSTIEPLKSNLPKLGWSHVKLIDLLERVCQLNTRKTDWLPFLPTVVYLLQYQSLSLSHKIRLLNLLPVILCPASRSSSFDGNEQSMHIAKDTTLKPNRDGLVVDALKTLIVTQLPLRNDELWQKNAQKEEYRKVFISLLTTFEITGSRDVLEALLIPFCRETDHPFDSHLLHSLTVATTRHQCNIQLTLSWLELCYNQTFAACTPMNSSANPVRPAPVPLDFTYRVANKFLFPLLLNTSHSTLELFSTEHVTEWFQLIQHHTTADRWLVTRSFTANSLFAVELGFKLFALIYQRLAKESIHDRNASVVQAFVRRNQTAASDSVCEGMELTKALIKLTHEFLKRTLRQTDPVTPVSLVPSRRKCHAAAWSCLTAAVCTTQTKEGFFKLLLLPNLLAQILPHPQEMTFQLPKMHPSLWIGQFFNVRESNWSNAHSTRLSRRNPKDQPSARLGKHVGIGGNPSATQVAEKNVAMSASLFQGSTLALELSRFDQLAGTQLSSLHTTRMEPVESDMTTSASKEAMNSPLIPRSTGIRLVMDQINRESLMPGLVGLLNCWPSPEQALGKLEPNETEPYWSSYLLEQWDARDCSVNVRLFIAKLVINCSEIFRQHGHAWLDHLLRFLSHGPTDGTSPAPNLTHQWSTLTNDLCLLLIEWSDESRPNCILPSGVNTCDLATRVLDMLVQQVCGAAIELEREGPSAASSVLSPAKPSPQTLMELFTMLIGSWETRIRPPYESLMDAIDRTDSSPKQSIIALDLLLITLRSNVLFSPKDDKFPGKRLSDGLCRLLEHTNKIIYAKAFDAAALLLCKIQSTSKPNDREVDQLDRTLGQLPPSLHNLVMDLWSRTVRLTTRSLVTSTSSTSVDNSNYLVMTSGVVKVACQAAITWKPLQSRLLDQIGSTCKLVSLDERTLRGVLSLLLNHMEDDVQNSSTMAFESTSRILFISISVEQETGDEGLRFFMHMISKTSHLMELSLRVGAAWISCLDEHLAQNRHTHTEDDPASITYGRQIFSILHAALACLGHGKSPEVHSAVYQLCIVAWQFNRRIPLREFKQLAILGLLYGVSTEKDNEVASPVRTYFLRHCLPDGSVERAVRILSYFGNLSDLWTDSTEDLWNCVCHVISQLFPSVLSTCVSLIMNSVTETAEYKQAFFENALDPDVAFRHTSMPGDYFLSTMNTDPTLLSLAPVILQERKPMKNRDNPVPMTETLMNTSSTLDTFTMKLGTATQSYGTQPVFKKPRLDADIAKGSYTFDPNSYGQETRDSSENTNSTQSKESSAHQLRVNRLRQRFQSRDSTDSFDHPSTASSSLLHSPDKAKRQIFRNRAVARQRDEMRSLTTATKRSNHSNTTLGVLTGVPRDYRTGPIPDVEQVAPANLIGPLIQMASSQIEMSRIIFVMCYSSLMDASSGRQTTTGLLKSREIFHSLHGLLQLARQMATFTEKANIAVVGQITQACLDLLSRLCGIVPGSETIPLVQSEGIQLDSTIISTAALLSQHELEAITLLEEVFNHGCIVNAQRHVHYQSSSDILGRTQCPQPHERLPLQSSPDGTAATASTVWWDLVKLYRDVGYFEEVPGWLLDRWADGNPLYSRVGQALVDLGKPNYAYAQSALEMILTDSSLWRDCNQAMEPGLQSLCRDGLITCLDRMMQWDDLNKWTGHTVRLAHYTATIEDTQCLDSSVDVQHVPLSDVWTTVCFEPTLLESTIPFLIRARLKRLQEAIIDTQFGGPTTAMCLEEASIEVKDLLESALDQQNARVLIEARFPEELSLFYCWKDDFLRAQHFHNEAMKQCVLDLKDKRKALHELESFSFSHSRVHTLTELGEFLQLVTSKDINERAISDLSAAWNNRTPHPTFSPLALWDDVVLNRLFYLTILCSKLGPPEEVTLQSPASLSLLLDDAIVRWRLCEIDASLAQRNPRLALRQLKGIRLLTQRQQTRSDSMVDCWLHWCEAFSDSWVSWAEDSVTMNQCTSDAADSLKDLVRGVAHAGFRLAECGASRGISRPHSDGAVSHKLAKFSLFTKLGRLHACLSSLVDMLGPNAPSHLSEECMSQLDRLHHHATPLVTHSTDSWHDSTSLPLASSDSLDSRFTKGTLDFCTMALQLAHSINSHSMESEKRSIMSSHPSALSAPLLVMADFADRKLTQTDQQNRDSSQNRIFTHSFIRAVLTGMKLHCRAAQLRFPRALQLATFKEASGDVDRNETISNDFIDLSSKLPTWMFLQWLDLLLSELFATNSPTRPPLVSQILQRVATDYPRLVVYPLTVITTAIVEDASTLRGQMEIDSPDVMTTPRFYESTRCTIARLFETLSHSPLYTRFVKELTSLEEPKMVLKDWLTTCARRCLAHHKPQSMERRLLIDQYRALLRRQLRRSARTALSSNGSIVAVESDTCMTGTYRTCMVEKIVSACHTTFGEDGSKLLNLSLGEFERAITVIESTVTKQQDQLPQSGPPISLLDYSPWLARFNSSELLTDERLELPTAQFNLTQKPCREHGLLHVHRIDSSLKTLASLRQPKLIQIVGSNATVYPWLVKFGEDLRQDARLQHLFAIVNQSVSSQLPATSSLNRDVSISETNLHPLQTHKSMSPIHTYSVVPLSSRHGLVEWVQDTTTLLAFYNKVMQPAELQTLNNETEAYDRLTSNIDYATLWCDSAGVPNSALVTRFRQLEHCVHTWRLLRRGLLSISHHSAHFMQLRHTCIRTHASLSAVHYVFGIGDRHPLNFLLCHKTGTLIGIDFGYAFGVATLVLPVPELVPFRLTASHLELLEPSGPVGLFGVELARALTALRTARPMLNALLQVFVKDASCWAIYSHLTRQSESEFTRGRINLAMCKLSGHPPGQLLEDELRGRYGSQLWFETSKKLLTELRELDMGPDSSSASSKDLVTVERQALQLVRLASSPQLLARAHTGWRAFV